MGSRGPSVPGRTRRPRRDAELNRERILAAAISVMKRDGLNAPLATIAAEAGVGIGTLYRSYADREALLDALVYRSYGLLNGILDEIESQDLPGLRAIREYLSRVAAISGQLVLPLRGAPPVISAEAVQARRDVMRRLEEFIDRGHTDQSIQASVNAIDIVMFSALNTQPLPHGPSWPLIAARQAAIFLNGLAATGPADIPGPAVTRQDIETTFALHAPSLRQGP
jgi:AcrR family transcriptional regulator